MARNMSATIPFGKTLGYWFYKAYKDIAMLQPILHHSHPFITLHYIGITEEETSNVLKTF
ncbi:integrase [Bacillus sp. ISL-4]|uniref:integrase n=1 Tax=Bacillus sp. ISL-4 TaxID=2819125 RepID=UPI001BE927C0|nr:integrase [Bacillus sp. ISL-4]MBT2666956.1 integrase [Bacillus sp. ISL-4]